MRKIVVLALLAVGLAACDANRSWDICEAAMDGAVVQNRQQVFENCLDDVTLAGRNAEHEAAQKYRNLPRTRSN